MNFKVKTNNYLMMLHTQAATGKRIFYIDADYIINEHNGDIIKALENISCPKDVDKIILTKSKVV